MKERRERERCIAVSNSQRFFFFFFLQENPEANLYEEFHLASAELPGAEGQQEQLQQGQDGGFEEVQVEQVPTQEQQHAPPASGTFEQGMPYNLDASMSPEGRREFERY